MKCDCSNILEEISEYDKALKCHFKALGIDEKEGNLNGKTWIQQKVQIVLFFVLVNNKF